MINIGTKTPITSPAFPTPVRFKDIEWSFANSHHQVNGEWTSRFGTVRTSLAIDVYTNLDLNLRFVVSYQLVDESTRFTFDEAPTVIQTVEVLSSRTSAHLMCLGALTDAKKGGLLTDAEYREACRWFA